MRTSREVLNILQNHYPERLGKFLILDAPWYFNAFFSVIKVLPHPRLAPASACCADDRVPARGVNTGCCSHSSTPSRGTRSFSCLGTRHSSARRLPRWWTSQWCREACRETLTTNHFSILTSTSRSRTKRGAECSREHSVASSASNDNAAACGWQVKLAVWLYFGTAAASSAAFLIVTRNLQVCRIGRTQLCTRIASHWSVLVRTSGLEFAREFTIRT